MNKIRLLVFILIIFPLVIQPLTSKSSVLVSINGDFGVFYAGFLINEHSQYFDSQYKHYYSNIAGEIGINSVVTFSLNKVFSLGFQYQTGYAFCYQFYFPYYHEIINRLYFINRFNYKKNAFLVAYGFVVKGRFLADAKYFETDFFYGPSFMTQYVRFIKKSFQYKIGPYIDLLFSYENNLLL